MASGTTVGFDFIVVSSLLFGLLVLGTAVLSQEIHRQAPWYGLLVPALFYDIVLVIGMGQQTSSEFPMGLCAFQAVFLYSIPGWAVVAFGCFVITFYFELKYLIAAEDGGDEPRTLSRNVRLSLVLVPLLSFFGFLFLNGLTVILDPKTPNVSSNLYKLYCTPRTHTGLYVGGAIMSVAMFIWIFIIMGVLLRRHYSKLRGKGDAIFHQVLSIYIRATAISIAASVVIGLYIFCYATNSADNIFTSYCLSFPGMIIFVVFGTQRDIMKCWAFWRKKPTYIFRDQTSSSFGQLETPTTSTIEGGQTDMWKVVGYNWSDRRSREALP